MALEQNSAPLFEALWLYNSKGTAHLHTPGHCRGRGIPETLASFTGRAVYSLDLTELPGLDDLHNPGGVIAQAQALAAAAFGADHTFFLVNGTTAGIQALLLATVGEGAVILPRNMHRSVLGGLILSGANPVYMVPPVFPGFGFAASITPEQLKVALAEYPEARAVMMVHPNYYGVAGDLPALVSAVHEVDKPLLVDEAHGAHLRFHPALPPDALSAGADASVQSTHKLGGALTQASMLHLKGFRLDRERVAAALRYQQTTSPSYILMVSLDLARQQLALHGRPLLERTVELAEKTRRRLAAIKGLVVLGPEHAGKAGTCVFDPTRLVICVRGLGLSGYQVHEMLARRYQVQVEMADWHDIVALVSIGTAAGDCERLVQAMADIACREARPAGVTDFAVPEMPVSYKKQIKPREAWFAPSCRVPLAEAKGRISSEMVAVYPPGIPVLCPGEEVTGEVYEYLSVVWQKGIPCQGPGDQTLATLKVVVE